MLVVVPAAQVDRSAASAALGHAEGIDEKAQALLGFGSEKLNVRQMRQIITANRASRPLQPPGLSIPACTSRARSPCTSNPRWTSVTSSVNVWVSEDGGGSGAAAEMARAYRDAGVDLAVFILPLHARPALLDDLAQALAAAARS